MWDVLEVTHEGTNDVNTAKSILTSSLNINEFFRVSQCKSAKDMWNELEVIHE